MADIALAGSTITFQPNDDQLGRLSLEFAAMDGEVGFGQIPIPDSAAAISTATGRSARVDETHTRLIDGFIVDNDRDRGPQPAGTAREYTFSVADPNVLLTGFRVIRSRSAETDVARVLAFAAADFPTADTTWVLNVSTVTLPAKAYSTVGWADLITDLVEFTGKTLFVHDKAFGGRCLHYHPLTAGHTCGLTISDVPTAVNGVTVFAPQQPTRTLTSMDLRNDIMGRDQSGRTSTATDATSITAHDADGLQHQELYDFEAVNQADLDVKTAALLASTKDDLATYRCSIGPLDGTALAKIRVGDFITITSSVLGLTATAQRISHMTLTPISAAAGGLGWNATLEMGAPIRRRARVKPYIRHVVLSPDVTPPPPWFSDCTPMIETFTRTVVEGFGTSEFNGTGWQGYTDPTKASVNGTQGRFLLTDIGGLYGTSQFVELPFTYPIHMRALFKIVGATEASSLQFYLGSQVNELPFAGIGFFRVALGYLPGDTPGPLSMDVLDHADGSSSAGATTYPLGASDPADLFVWLECIMDISDFQVRCWFDGSAAPAYDAYTFAPQTTTLPSLLEVSANATSPDTPDWRIEKIEFLCESVPTPGRTVVNEFVGVGDGVRSSWTLKYPYLEGSPLLGLDGLMLPNTISTDPITGEVTLDFVPEEGETVTAHEYVVGPP